MNDYDYLDITNDNEKTSWINKYRVVWVDSDYNIREIFIEAESKKKAIIKSASNTCPKRVRLLIKKL